MKVKAISRCYYDGCDAYRECEISIDFKNCEIKKKCLTCGKVYEGGLEWYALDT